MCMRVCTLDHPVVFDSATPWTAAHQAPLSMGFSGQGCWSGLPFSSPGDLPNPEIEPGSLLSPALAAGILTTTATWEAHKYTNATRPPGLFLKQLRSHIPPYRSHAQYRSSGPNSGFCTRNLLPLLTPRIEHSPSLSSWNLAEPEAPQKAVLFALPAGWVSPAAAWLRLLRGIRVGAGGLLGFCSSTSGRPSQDKVGGLVNLRRDV